MNFLSKVPIDWLRTGGKGARIGLCDTVGNPNHPAIKHAVKECKCFGGRYSHDHGVHVAGIICGKPGSITRYRSLASEAELYIATVPVGRYSNYGFLTGALEWLLSFSPNVVNISMAFRDDVPEIQELIRALSKKGIVVAAHSNNMRFPHSYEETLSVGGEESVSSSVDIVAESSFVSSLGKDQYGEMSGSSMAAAFVSSVAALAKAYDPRITKRAFLGSVVGEALLPLTAGVQLPLGRDQLNLAFDD